MKNLILINVCVLLGLTNWASANDVSPSPSPSPALKTVVKTTPTPTPLIEIKKNDQALSYGGYSKNLSPNHFSLNVQYGDFTNTRSFGGELEYRNQRWGLGVIAEGSTVSDSTSSVSISNNTYGIIGHLYSLPYWYSASKNVIAPGVFVELGDMRFQPNNQDALPNYLFGSFGVDLSYMVLAHFNLYGKLGLDYVDNTTSIQYFGTELNVGVRLDF
jgi:hypothetical protein